MPRHSCVVPPMLTFEVEYIWSLSTFFPEGFSFRLVSNPTVLRYMDTHTVFRLCA